MKEHFEKALLDFDFKKEYESKGDAVMVSFFANDPGIFMSFWYGSLFVVIEGWKELGLHDPEIDTLLDSQNVEHLRRYRNGTFHFQKDYFDKRLHEFTAGQDTVAWVRTLHGKFSSYFFREVAKENQALKGIA